jgi:hypothetical protein
MTKRALTPTEAGIASTALDNALTLCSLVINGNSQDLASALRDAFSSRATWPHIQGFINDFKKIEEALQSLKKAPNFAFDDAPDDPGDIAYVYPSQTGKIYLHKPFFDYPALEQAGILVHEASHWTTVRGTDDHAYGSHSSSALAYCLKRNNADSFRLLAEKLAKDKGIKF